MKKILFSITIIVNILSFSGCTTENIKNIDLPKQTIYQVLQD